MRFTYCVKVLLSIAVLSARSFGGEGAVAFVEVKANAHLAPSNGSARVYFRVPAGYDPESEVRYRVMVYFGGRNSTGEREAAGNRDNLGFDQWADAHDIFIVAPGFKDDNYWVPDKWSGKALRDALAAIRKKYRIDDKHLLFYGYSAGSQASNLFPAWQAANGQYPRAWVSHAGGVFFTPSKAMRRIAGLVTCGDADATRYVISRRFVTECRKQDINVVFKSYPNLNHAVPLASARFAQDFLTYYHYLYWDDLDPDRKNPKPKRESVAFVGDDQEGEYWPAKDKAIRNILKEDRVYLPSKELAEAWGQPARRWLNALAQAGAQAQADSALAVTP